MLIAQSSIILIVNTQSKDTNVLVGFLQELGCKILVTNTGERALKKLQNVLPDLILMDVIMPGMDGFETCRRLKASKKTKDIPVIFMTASSESMDKIKGLKVGAVDYITKPFQPEQVLPRLENQIKISRLQKQIEEQNRKLEQETNTRRQLEERLKLVITERNRVEERNRALLNAIPDPIIRQHVDGTFLDVRAKEGDLIVPTQTLIGTNVSDLPIPDAVKQGLIECLQTAVATGELQIYEYELQMPNGVRTYESRFVKSGTDEAIRIVRDVTERKRAEAALRQSEARFRGIFENAAIAIALSKADGTVIAVNPTYEAFLGYSEAEILCRSFAEITHPDELGIDIALAQEVINGVRDSFDLEKRYIHKDGQLFWGRLTLSAIRNLAGEIQFTVAIMEDINDIKLRELALKESQRRFRAIFNNSFQFTAVLTPDGTVIEVNQTALDFAGVKPADVTGLPFWETCWWREGVSEQGSRGYFGAGEAGETYRRVSELSVKQEQLREAIATAASGQFVRYEVDIRGVGDSAIAIDFSIKPVLDETGNVVLLIPEGRDITERKKVEQRLRLFESAVVNANDAILIAEAEPISLPGPRIIYVNEAFTRMTGYSAEEVIGQTPRLLQGEKTDRTQLDRVRHALQTWQSVRVELINYRKDGSQFWVELEIVPVADETGWFTHWVSVQRDITERKLAEAALRESEARFRAIFEYAAVGISKVTLSGQFLQVNQRLCQLYGYTESELLALTFQEITYPIDLDADLKYWQQLLAGEIPSYSLEKRYVRKDGQILWGNLSVSVVCDSAGVPQYALGVMEDISERKQAEIALRDSEERWQLVLKGNNDVIWDVNLKTNEVFFSPRWKEMLGYEDQEIANHNDEWLTRIHPDDLDRVIQSNQNYFNQKTPNYTVEYRLRCKDGNYKWILGRAQAVWDEAGNPVRLVGSNRDISDRKRAEEALQQSEARLQKLAANVPGMLYEFVRHPDGSYRFAYVSSGCREINEFEPEQLLENMALGFEIVHPDDAPRLVESIKISAQTLEPWVWEGRIITPSGKLKWTRGAARPERCANGDILWHGLVVDVSDRKRTEIELRAAKTALEQQIERVLLSERITQEIRSSLKPQQIFQTAAIQISQAFGVDRCLIHIYIEHPTPQIPFVAEYKQAAIESILDREVPVLGNPHAELLLTQDQAVATYNVYADPVLKAASSLCQQIGLKSMLAVRTSYQGKPNGLIALHQCDSFRQWRAQEIELIESLGAQLGIAIAQANLLEQEKQRRRELAAQNHALEKAKQQAEAANQAKSHFLSKMSHELRTPLNAILGFSQVMARDKSLKTEQRDYLDIINRSGEHLLALINDILSMSKIEAGQVTLNKNRFDLYRLLDSMEEMLQLKAASSGIELLFERTKDVPRYIETDESKLRQVLINLLGNALKFTQVGSVTLRVRMGNRDRSLDISTSKAKPLGLAGRSSNIGNTEEVQPTPYVLIFEVEDTGLGIAADELDSLFDPFVQTQTGRQSLEGTGLGLSISQQFVQLMGGDITVRSTLGQGTIFTFDIQVGLATSADEQPIYSKRRVIGLEPNQPTYRILVIEDAAVNRKLLVKILESLGFEVRTAVNGQEGVALWEKWSPHLIWMDVVMPVMDGYEATRAIRVRESGKQGEGEKDDVGSSIEEFFVPAKTASPNNSPRTVIIALTASAFEEQREAILRAGCDDFLPKPFREEVLLEKIALHLGVRYLYEEQPPALSQSPVFVEQLSPDALSVMPVSWRTQLHQAALYADEELMNQLIEQIPLEHSSLRRILKEMLSNFRLEQLINLSERACHE